MMCAASGAPPKVAAMMLPKVRPTWTVERNFEGLARSSKAAFAPLLPSSARRVSRRRLEDTSAISESSKIPMVAQQANMTNNSTKTGLGSGE